MSWRERLDRQRVTGELLPEHVERHGWKSFEHFYGGAEGKADWATHFVRDAKLSAAPQD